MQIRVPTRQDEKKINDFILGILKDNVPTPISNIEQSFYAKNGAIFTAEENGEVEGLIAACPKNDETLSVNYYLVNENSRKYNSQMINIVINFARRLYYKTIEVDLVYKMPDDLFNSIKDDFLNNNFTISKPGLLVHIL